MSATDKLLIYGELLTMIIKHVYCIVVVRCSSTIRLEGQISLCKTNNSGPARESAVTSVFIHAVC